MYVLLKKLPLSVYPLLSDLDEKAGAGFETTDAEDGVGEGGAHVGGAHAGDGHGSGNGDGGGGDCVGGANEDGPTPGTGGCFYLRHLRLKIWIVLNVDRFCAVCT